MADTKTKAQMLAGIITRAGEFPHPDDIADAAAELRRLDAVEKERDAWRETVWALGRSMRCLPSMFADDNGHILRAVSKLKDERDALHDEVERLRPSTAPVALTDAQKQEIHHQTGAGHALICLVESFITGQAVGKPVKQMPPFDEFGDSVLAKACDAGDLHRIDLRRAYEVLRKSSGCN
jgi:hypothetical protein